MPLQPIEQDPAWSFTANCYAYACNCREPKNGHLGGAIPGATKMLPAFAGDADYSNRLINGAVADGLILLSRNNIALMPNVPAGHYRVALFANQYGFHWMRHDPVLNRWSWKSGNAGPVYYSALNIALNRSIYIKDENFYTLYEQKADYVLSFTQTMSFVAYFAVPEGRAIASI